MPLNSISPIDGRYKKYTDELVLYFSEAASMKYKIILEGEYLIPLSNMKEINLRKFSSREKTLIRNLYDLDNKDADIINQIELTGYKNIKATEQDFKAIEYYIKDKLSKTS